MQFKKIPKRPAQALKTAAELAPMRSTIRSSYIDYLIQGNSIEEARKLLEDMVDKAPDYIPAWVSMMNLDLAEKKYDDASQCVDTILSRDDRNFDALAGAGHHQFRPGAMRKKPSPNLNN